VSTHRRRSLLRACLLAGLLVVQATPAAAAERWASAGSTDATGACASAAPCTLEHAITGAAAGDDVIVAPGDYAVSRAITTLVPLTIQGQPGLARPRLIGASGLPATTLTFKTGGTLRHLQIEASASGEDALRLQGGTGERLVLISSTGDGAKLSSASSPTVLRDSVAVTRATASGLAALKLRDGGGDAEGVVALRNVTALGTAGSAVGIRCDADETRPSLVNVIVRGALADVQLANDAQCLAATSNLRGTPEGLTLEPGNQASAPIFLDAAALDLRPAASSPTVDAGGQDALLGAFDLDGRLRSLGGGPDIGAHEYSASWATGPEGSGVTGGLGTGPATGESGANAPTPALGRAVVVAPASGTVLVKRPGARRRVRLSGAATVPVGSVLDTRRGSVRLQSALDARGTTQTGTFGGGTFQVRQDRAHRGTTDLVLRGASFAACRRASRGLLAAGRRTPVQRRLWSRDRHGRFRTHGRNSVASARGTAWVTEDRCDGTLTRVTEGSVLVRPRRGRRAVLVRAGHAFLARATR